MNKICLLILLALLCVGGASAQTKKSSKAKKTVKLTPEQELYEELLPSTAKIMFIDSLVADKETFLSLIPLPKDAGFLTSSEDGTVEYTNEFKDTRITARGDSIFRHLFISHRYGSDWETPRELDELDNELPDYPFLMADGVTLYFSAEGEGTVGGRDIFRTTYNTEDLEFYEPANAGLPFNSPANDYLLAISDIDNLGWLVTDRNQEEGKVCIYTFEPMAARITFGDDVPTEDIKVYAEIRQMKDSWGFGDYSSAVAREAELLKRLEESDDEEKISFVVNDDKVYSSLDDFSSKSSRAQYEELLQDKEKLASLNSLLDSSRDSYAQTSSSKRYEIGRKIADLETEVEQLADQIVAKEKALRAAENK